MKNVHVTILAALVSVIAANAVEARAKSPSAQSVGLVLSGGGAKGIAEIGAIKAFEENGIPIDYVAGTSMGAIVGGLYAAGYSPDEMMELITSKTFMDASTGTIDPKYYYMFFTPAERPTMLNLRFSADKFRESKLLPSSIISPMPMNFSFMSIFAAHTAQCGGDFDKLFVPLRTVASDMTNKRKIVFGSGPMDDAVRASMSFPIVFKPVVLDGALLYDGGIYDNFPVDVMRQEFHPDIMIGVDIHSTDTVRGFPDIMQQMDLLVIRPTNNYEIPPAEGIKLRIDLNEFSLLDFPKAKEIYKIGYEHAMEMVDSIKTRVTARRSPEEVARRRAEFKSTARPVVFEDVDVDGGTPSENSYIEYFFTPEHRDTFGLEKAMDSYTKVISTGMLRDLDPRAVYNSRTGWFKLMLKADVKDKIDLGIGGYLSSSVNSMLFMTLGYRSFDFRTIDASLSAWVGQSYMAAEANARAILRHRQTSSIGLQAAIWRQKYYESDKLFYEDDSPAFITHLEGFVRLKYSFATGRRSVFDLGVGYAHLDDRFYNNDESIVDSDITRNVTMQDLGQIAMRWDRNTLDNRHLPTSGSRIAILGQGVLGYLNFRPGLEKMRSSQGKYSENEKWLQLEVNYRNYFRLGSRWSLGFETTMLASTRHLLPNYNAAIVNAPAFNPTAASYTLFNPQLRANSFVTAGLVPVYKLNDRFEIRGQIHGFVPFRPIHQGSMASAEYGDWFSKAAFFSELSASFKLPFGNLSVYGTYQTSKGDNWGVGLSFGYFIIAPKFLRLN